MDDTEMVELSPDYGHKLLDKILKSQEERAYSLHIIDGSIEREVEEARRVIESRYAATRADRERYYGKQIKEAEAAYRNWLKASAEREKKFSESVTELVKLIVRTPTEDQKEVLNSWAEDHGPSPLTDSLLTDKE